MVDKHQATEAQKGGAGPSHTARLLHNPFSVPPQPPSPYCLLRDLEDKKSIKDFNLIQPPSVPTGPQAGTLSFPRKPLRGGELATYTWQDPRPGQDAVWWELGWTAGPATPGEPLPPSHPTPPPAISAGRKERLRHHRLRAQRQDVRSQPPTHQPSLSLPEPRPLGQSRQTDRIRKAENKRHLMWEFTERCRAGVGGPTSNPTASATGTGRDPAASGRRPPGAGFL